MALEAKIIGLDSVKSMLQNLSEHTYEQTKKAMNKALLDAQTKITVPMATGVYGLQSRSGNLARSIKTDVSGTELSTLTGSIYTKSIYAPIHEKGGKIRGIDKYLSLDGTPYLNIPADANKTPAGITRKTAREVFLQGGYIVKITAPRAKYMVALNGKAMFWLVHSVELKARLNMVKSTNDEVPTLLSNLKNTLLVGDI